MEAQLTALQQTVQTLTQAVKQIQANQGQPEVGTQQVAQLPPGQVGQAGGQNLGELPAQQPVEIDTEHDSKFLKQLTQSRSFTDIRYQETETFVSFVEELEDWFRCAGISSNEVELLLSKDHYKLSPKLDGQVQIIISKHADDLVRRQLREAVPDEIKASGLGDLRNLYKAFGLNKTSQFVRLAATCLDILNGKGSKPFRAQFQRYRRTIHRAIGLAKKEDSDFLEKAIIATLAASYPQISQSLSVHLSLADQQSPSVLLESLSQAVSRTAKRKRVPTPDESEPEEARIKVVECYCSHCGKPNHSQQECPDSDKPQIRLSFKLHALRRNSSNGKITVPEVQQALDISHIPSFLKPTIAPGDTSDNCRGDESNLPFLECLANEEST